MSIDDVEDRYRAPALDKGLDILELLAETEEGLSQAEIAKALNRSPNEIYRMLDRLVRRGYIARTTTDRYELTLKLFALAHRHAPMRRLVSQAMPILRDFARAAGQSCHVAVYDRGEVIVVAQVDSPHYWGIAIRVGARVGLFDTGSGHILLAYAAPAERKLMAEEHEMMPLESRPVDLEARLADIVTRGFEQMESRQTPSVVNLAVPILGPHGAIVAALTCPYVQRLDATAPDQHAVLKQLIASGTAISRNAGGAD
ncbi:IclR family transcriptional regulator [Dongia sedimenti]|uniref:IclR family transcriptional regulator n=1 Tax=Dongia sedimenti TaxID=3064282 RepID=A0ABU0YM97_9PROT|nr:IclR family transcriptional regulator [Rhodospirillaceae bacterium R-7]